MIDGILLINKEKGITSYDVIRKLKKIFPKGQKIGHAGTLDPFASGLLVVLLGKGTKLMEKFHTFEKEYLVEGEFGYATDTQDITGERISEDMSGKQKNIVDIEEEIRKNFLGEISQIPPMYSAKKINGKKAYQFAREGKEVEIKPKDVVIKKFEIVNYRWPVVEFKIVCSTGTYVRTLINDLGANLGTYGTAISLKRSIIGKFNLDDAYDSEKISVENTDDILEKVVKLEDLNI